MCAKIVEISCSEFGPFDYNEVRYIHNNVLVKLGKTKLTVNGKSITFSEGGEMNS